MRSIRCFILSGILLSAAAAAFATDVLPPRFEATRGAERVAPQPPLRASLKAAPVVIATAGAAESDIAELRAANGNGPAPIHLGIVREVEPVAIGDGVAKSDGVWRWRGSVRATGAHRIRVRLDRVAFPAGTRLWIYPGSGEAVAFDASLAHGDTLWTPSVAGELATIEVEAPAAARFRIAAVADIRSRQEVAPQSTECITDLSCHTEAAGAFTRAIAFYEFVSGTHLLGCTGGLVNNIAADGTPYFLTANHCVRNQDEASTVETVWDYRSSSCNGSAPSLDSLQKYTGATLLVTSPASDVTLLRLAAIPPNRTFLGWDARPVEPGTALIHVSHPNADPQRFSSSQVETSSTGCASSPRPAFLYSHPIVGATDAGSSGAPAIIGNGLVVGQLKSGCGPDPNNACNPLNSDVDGAFSASYAVVRPWLDPAAACGTCVADASTACLLGNRFKVTIAWSDPTFGDGTGKVIHFTENRPDVSAEHGPLSETAFFSFYPFFPNAIEAMVKMTKGVTINDKYWVFVTGFAGSAHTITVQDTRTCAVWQESRPADAVVATRDYVAFPLP